MLLRCLLICIYYQLAYSLFSPFIYMFLHALNIHIPKKNHFNFWNWTMMLWYTCRLQWLHDRYASLKLCRSYPLEIHFCYLHSVLLEFLTPIIRKRNALVIRVRAINKSWHNTYFYAISRLCFVLTPCRFTAVNTFSIYIPLIP
jgi:hypothetical protein